MRAYVVVAAEPGKSRDVARQVASLPGVKMADACWGSRDVFAVVEVGESQELNKLVMDKIQRLGGVRETSTPHTNLFDMSVGRALMYPSQSTNGVVGGER